MVPFYRHQKKTHNFLTPIFMYALTLRFSMDGHGLDIGHVDLLYCRLLNFLLLLRKLLCFFCDDSITKVEIGLWEIFRMLQDSIGCFF